MQGSSRLAKLCSFLAVLQILAQGQEKLGGVGPWNSTSRENPPIFRAPENGTRGTRRVWTKQIWSEKRKFQLTADWTNCLEDRTKHNTINYIMMGNLSNIAVVVAQALSDFGLKINNIFIVLRKTFLPIGQNMFSRTKGDVFYVLYIV